MIWEYLNGDGMGIFYGDGTGKSDGDGDYFIYCITL